MKPNKIGFYQPNEQDEPVNTKIPDVNIELLKGFIELMYSTTGELGNKEFVTSEELRYELQGMIETTMPEISKALTELGFKTITIDRELCWEMYRID